MKSTVCIVIGLCIATVGPAIAGNAPEPSPLRARLELLDGSTLIGVPAMTAVVARTPYASLNIPLRHLRSFEVGADRATVSFKLANGDAVTGAADMGPIGLSTLFGDLSVGFEHVVRLHVLAGGAGVPVFWNALRSQKDVLSNSTGSNGRIQGDVVFSDDPPGVALRAAGASVVFPTPFGAAFPESGTIEFLWTPAHDENTSTGSHFAERFPFVITSRETQQGSAWPALVFYLAYRSHGGCYNKTVVHLGTGDYGGLSGAGTGLLLNLDFKAGQAMHVAITWDARRTDRLLKCYIDSKEVIPEEPSAPSSTGPSPAEIVRRLQAQYARLNTELEILRYGRRPDGADKEFDAGQFVADLKIWNVAKDVFEAGP